MATGRTIITDAYLELGIGTLGGTLSAPMANYGLRTLNRIWEQMASEISLVWASDIDTHTWPASTYSQDIAVSAYTDINSARPLEITGFQVRVNGYDNNLKEVSYEQIESSYSKTIEVSIPRVFAYRRTYPKGILYIYPLLASAATVRIESKKVMYSTDGGDFYQVAFELTKTVQVPPGYEEMLVTNLAVALGPAYGRPINPVLLSRAIKSKAALKAANEDHYEMWPDSNIPGLAKSSYRNADR